MPRGFAPAVEDARAEVGAERTGKEERFLYPEGKTLHDLRGTFATRLMYNGLSRHLSCDSQLRPGYDGVRRGCL
jgi:hypothetical protein